MSEEIEKIPDSNENEKKEEVPEEKKEEPSVEEKKEESPVEEKKEEPPVEEKKEEQPVEEKKEESPVEEKKEAPPVEEKKEEVPVEEKKEEAPVEEKKEEPSVEEKKEAPPVEEKKEEVPVEEKKEEAPVEEKKEEPSVEEKKEEPPVEEKKEEPSVEEKKEEPPVEEKKENQISSEEKNIPEEVLDQNDNSKEKDNIQENNKKEKEENNLKTEVLKVETPISNNSKEEKEKVISIIKAKITELKNNYNFCIQYYDTLHKITNYLNELTYEKIKNSVNDSSSYLSFFKNSSELFSKFTEQINSSNNIIKFPEKPKMNDNFLNNAIQATEKLFYENLSKFSKGLKQNIISKDPFSKLQDKVNKIEILKKTQLKKTLEMNERKKKLEKKYNSYQQLFDTFLPQENPIPNPESNNIENNSINDPNKPKEITDLVDYPDFIYVIKELIEEINSLILKNNLFIIDEKDSLLSINHLFVEINNVIKESLSSYIQESKVFFGADVIKKMEEIENYYKQLEESQKDNTFRLDVIFKEQKEKENIFNLLQQYFELLNKSDKVKKELISDKDAFSIDKYDNIVLFYEWLISISPQPTDLKVDELIVKKMEIKRDPGIFSKWKNTNMVLTKQDHIIFFDKIENPDYYAEENIAKIYEKDKTSFKKKADNKKKFLFELIANVKGKIMTFKGSNDFDALNEENLNAISNLFMIGNDKK